jgi:hypothetical protein
VLEDEGVIVHCTNKFYSEVLPAATDLRFIDLLSRIVSPSKARRLAIIRIIFARVAG